jgi:hypothetical protein
MKIDVTATIIKTSALIPLFVVLTFPQAFVATIFLILAYQYVIAFFLGLKVMPTMDVACFAGSDKSRVNVMSATFVEDFDYDVIKKNLRRVLERIPKARYQIV